MEARGFEFRRVSVGEITQIRPVTPAEASAYSTATIVLNNGERSLHAMAMVERNEDEFHRHMAQSLEEYTLSGLEARSLNRFHFRANWQLLNYLNQYSLLYRVH